MLKKVSFFIALASSNWIPSAHAAENPVEEDHTDLYVAESRPFVKRNSVAVGFGAAFGNPLYDSYVLGLAYDYAVKQNLRFGIGSDFFFNNESDFSKKLASSFTEEGYRANEAKPAFSWELFAEYAPLDGLVNLFSKSVVDFDLDFCLGLGSTIFRNPDRSSFLMSFGFRPTMSLNKNLGLFIGAFYFFDFLGSTTIKRVEMRAGTLWRF